MYKHLCLTIGKGAFLYLALDRGEFIAIKSNTPKPTIFDYIIYH